MAPTPTPAIFARGRKLLPEPPKPEVLYTTSTGEEGHYLREPSRSRPLSFTEKCPSAKLLYFWWTCYRKLRFRSEEEAASAMELHLQDKDFRKLHVYSCETCGFLHTGRGATRPPLTPEYQEELERQWRKWDKRPAVEELKQAMEAPASFGRFVGDLH